MTYERDTFRGVEICAAGGDYALTLGECIFVDDNALQRRAEYS